MSKHLCAIDCMNVCKCEFACSKVKKPELYPWLKAEKNTYRDNGVKMRAFRVVACDRYVKDIRSVCTSLKGFRRVHVRWTAAEIEKLISLYNKQHTLFDIADIMNRTDSGIQHMIARLKKEGRIK